MEKEIENSAVLARFFVPGSRTVRKEADTSRNPRKKRKIEATQKETTVAQIHEKSTKKTKNRTTVKGRQSSANPQKIDEKKQNFGPSNRSTPIGRKINATNPGPRKILEETKKTKNFRGPRKIANQFKETHEK